MVKFQTRRLVATFVLVDVATTSLAWILAYFLRFDPTLLGSFIPVTKGVPDLSRYLLLLPFIAVVWPAVLYFHGLYQLKRGRSRIDEFFAIVFSVLIGSGLTLGATLYVRVYYRFQPAVAPLWEYSQAVFALFLILDVALLNAGRWALRRYLERMWAAGYNGRALAVVQAEQIDQIYVALSLEDHAKLVGLIKSVANECVDIKVVPDLVQYATIKAALEDLDGIPIISLNEVPLSGWSSMVKRLMDIVVASTVLLALLPIFPVIALLIRLFGGRGKVLLAQERMTLDGRTFQIYKFRTMIDEAEKDTGPVFASPEDPRRTAIGCLLRKHNLDELPQLLNVLKGDMSLVGPRPERPPFVAQFRERIPQYMRRHRVKSGITGWAQVNGWRGNTSIEKRIEFDLYYIENWSLLLDVKILILTLFRGFGQKHAY